VAFLYGPIVLSGELGRTGGLVKSDFWQIQTTVPRKLVSESEMPVLVAEENADLTQCVKPVDIGSMHFRSIGFQPADVSLVPFFENHFQRYAIYWRKLTPVAYREELEQQDVAKRELASLKARTVDTVEIGDDASEKAHDFKSESSFSGPGAYGEQTQSHWRDARDGGWFSYKLVVNDHRPLLLRCTYWGDERGARTFDVLVNDKVVTTESLTSTGKHEFVHKDIPLTDEVTSGHNYLTVKFQAHPKNTAGGLFGLSILRDE
jgi:hypothetical protein